MASTPDPIAAALENCAKGLHRIADALNRLGNGNAATEAGAIEGHSMTLRDAIQHAAETLSLALGRDRD